MDEKFETDGFSPTDVFFAPECAPVCSKSPGPPSHANDDADSNASSGITLDSGRGKRRLRDIERTRVLEGLLQGDVGWGLPQQVFSNDRLHKTVQGLYKEAYTRE